MSPQDLRPVCASDECEIDVARRELRVLGSPVPLGSRAFEVIEALAASVGKLVTKNELMDRIWPGADVLENTLQVHAGAIRKALGPCRHLLKTESGRGYRLLGSWTVRHQDFRQQPSGLQRIVVSGQPLRTNIPAAVTRIIGRAAAAERVRDLMSAYRIVTLTGPGGIGKTALVTKVARRSVDLFSAGGGVVELASLSDAELLPSALAQILGIRAGAETMTLEIIARSLGSREFLLVLDNCEHVIDAAADLADILVRNCPRITILATSREALRIDGEAVFRLPPLEVPALDKHRPEDMLGHSAVEMFVDRATASGLRGAASVALLPEIGAICRDLDGIPLAIEFAAARAATLGVRSVAASLRDRFALLTSGRRNAPPRHRTLRAALDWSYQLLSEPERTLLRQLAVFQGGFSIEAATAVTQDGADTGALMSGVANLVAKSLVSLDGSTTDRWRLLETIRAYAVEKLVENAEADPVARRHAAYFCDFSLRIATDPESGVSPVDVAPYAREIDNVRAALDWAFSAAGDVATGVVLTAAYAPVWANCALLFECRERCEHALFRLDQQPTVTARLRLQLQLGFGLMAVYTRQSIPKAMTVLASALDIAENLNDQDAEFAAISGLWLLHYYSGESQTALALADRLSALGSSGGDRYVQIAADRAIGNSLHHLGDQYGAQARLEGVIARSAMPATPRRRFFPQTDQRVMARGYLSRVLLLRGYLDRAAEQAQTCLDDAIAIGSELVVCQALRLAVCHTALMSGDLAAAERDIARLLDIANSFNAPLWLSAARFFQGKLLIAQGAFEAGSTLLRSEIAACEATGLTNWYPEFLGVFAEGLAGLGRFSEALAAIDQALAKAESGGERYYVAELLRLRGELLLAQSEGEHATAIEACYRSALTEAREQGALLFELKAALALARWRVRQGRAEDAREVLAPVYGRFVEGFGAADLRAAKALLDALDSRSN